ncbi:sigma-54 interaction domain-containing protein [Bhargavaea massiliensis]|uniref:sigma-54 interaction domain-containing protein n=1 Tax=Bhargavaea massiliensis TaxID=2697500 RepID=UPI001BCC2A69|nr:sigma 54-interacting transcriptional regulator [Bhargavaea massiliensis]
MSITKDLLIRSIEQSYEGFILSDGEGRVFYANQAVETISGTPLSQIINKTPEEMQEDGAIIRQSRRVLQKNPLTIYQKLRTGREVFIVSKPIVDEEGKTICYAANYISLSNLNRLYKEHLSQASLNYVELEKLREVVNKADDLISVSSEMEEVKILIQKVAATDATILILGESGTGKEVVAKNIHNQSKRNNAPYIQINCSAIPEHLMEAELFGYEKGAFTGASTSKPGLLEVANNGTILLDEIGDMPLAMQAKLLRTIQTNEITRVGGTAKKHLNVRYIAATNKDLKQAVEEGAFREDLYYRLNVLPLRLPPLRERQRDIVHLTQHFLDKFNKKYHKQLVLAKETKEIFMRYRWPGNVRQLENMVEQLVILSEGSQIRSSQLPPEIADKLHPVSDDPVSPLHLVVSNAEKMEIQKALSKYPSVRQAAKALGVSHPTLLRKIKTYGLREA